MSKLCLLEVMYGKLDENYSCNFSRLLSKCISDQTLSTLLFFLFFPLNILFGRSGFQAGIFCILFYYKYYSKWSLSVFLN